MLQRSRARESAEWGNVLGIDDDLPCFNGAALVRARSGFRSFS